MEKTHFPDSSDPLLDELEKALESDFHKSCIEAYLAKASAMAIAQIAIDVLAKAANEAK